MKVGIIQCNPVTGACGDNAAMLLRAVKEAAEKGAELCIAPELVLCGPNAGDLFLRKDFVALCRSRMEELALELAKDKTLPPLLLGAPVANPVPRGKALQNCAVFLNEGKAAVITRKCLLPTSNALNDARYFEPGIACGVLNYKGWRIAVTVDEDAWNNSSFFQDKRAFANDPVADVMQASTPDAIINIAAYSYAIGKPVLQKRVLGWLSQHYRVPLLAANLVGGYDSLIYHGNSMAFNAEGQLVAKAPMFEEAVLIVDLVKNARIADGPEPSIEEELWRAMVLGTRDFAQKSGFKKAVVGLSGGIDSSLVACIAVDAFGKDNVTGIMMPSVYSSRGSIEDSEALARNLGIKTMTFQLEPVMEGYRTTIASNFDGGLHGLTEENMQARIRGALLMAFANEYNAVVLNTGNKSEAACGYCTLYGDLMGALCVIGDLYKHQVYAECRYVNAKYGRVIVPEAIFTKAPSAELAPGQKDSDSLPPYEELDTILQMLFEQGKGLKEIVAEGFNFETVKRVFTLIQKAQFKRQQAPTGLQLTNSFFGSIWHMPIACLIDMEEK